MWRLLLLVGWSTTCYASENTERHKAHLNTTTTLQTAIELLDSAKPRDAATLIKQALRDPKRHDRGDDDELWITLSTAYADLGKLNEAVAAAENALTLLSDAVGDADPRTGRARATLADHQASAGLHADAATTLGELVAMMRERLGSGHPAYALTLQKLGSALVSADRPAAAIKPREELVTLLSAQPLDDVGARLAEAHQELSLAIALSANKRAQLERALDHANKALQLHESGAVGRAPGRGAASSTVLAHARSANAVAGILERLGRDDEAVSTMGYAYQLAAAQADAEDEIEAEYVMQARRNLEGLKRKVRWKLKQASKVDEL